MKRDQVIEYISTCNPSDLLQLLDAMIDPVAEYIGAATGIENDRHAVLLQLCEDEKNV